MGLRHRGERGKGVWEPRHNPSLSLPVLKRDSVFSYCLDPGLDSNPESRGTTHFLPERVGILGGGRLMCVGGLGVPVEPRISTDETRGALAPPLSREVRTGSQWSLPCSHTLNFSTVAESVIARASGAAPTPGPSALLVVRSPRAAHFGRASDRALGPRFKGCFKGPGATGQPPSHGG